MRVDGVFETPIVALRERPFPVTGRGYVEIAPDRLKVRGPQIRWRHVKDVQVTRRGVVVSSIEGRGPLHFKPDVGSRDLMRALHARGNAGTGRDALSS